jgi:nitroreductase
VELDAAIAGRRMYRRFLDEPVAPALVDALLDRARRAPSAGHTQGWDWLVLEGPEQIGRFWSLDADEGWLAAPDHPGLLLAPVIIVPLAHHQAYVDRYREADKTGRGPAWSVPYYREADKTGRGPAWSVPYWLTDTAFATMLLLLGAVEEGLGALFFALHRDPRATVTAFGVPHDREPLGAVAIGWPDPADRPGSSSHRPTRSLADQVHRGRW